MEVVNLILVDGHEDKINRAQQSYPVEFHIQRPNAPPPQYKTMTEWKAPRVIMTHLTEELMPSQIYQGKGKVVYVIRNPKDTTVSNWKFIGPMNFDPKYEKWDDFVRESFSEDMVFGSWFTHVLNFWKKHRHDKNFLFLKYEDMKRDLKGAAIQISDFLGKNLSDEAIERVVEFSSLKSMKARFNQAKEAKDTKEEAPQSTPADKASAPSGDGAKAATSRKIGAPSIIRKGIVGDWKTMFTVAQNEQVDALYREKMAGSGLTIQFE
ncbi:sulfotransferase 1A1-like [Patiria miniata]|uniref:Sulfotransferase domain-containing protein n=1 Tax=Patiria miniata TaxID=46514 RepID=A0A913ZIQ7_PATMI|nr:sulfotransferase 1A1-like [Patiria miniata]